MSLFIEAAVNLAVDAAILSSAEGRPYRPSRELTPLAAIAPIVLKADPFNALFPELPRLARVE